MYSDCCAAPLVPHLQTLQGYVTELGVTTVLKIVYPSDPTPQRRPRSDRYWRVPAVYDLLQVIRVWTTAWRADEASRTLPVAGRAPSCTIPFPLALTLWPVPA